MTTSNDTHGATITVPQTAGAPSDLDALDFGWTDDDRVVVPITKMARLRWLNGAATDEQTMAIGWHIECEINPLIDETLEGMGMQRYVVQHRTADKDGNTQKAYWRVHPCSLIVIAEGVLSSFQMRDTDERTGIAYAREIERDDSGAAKRYDDGRGNIKMHKVLKLRAYVHEIALHGYSEWLPLTLTGTIVECMLEALGKQIEALKAFHGLTGRKAPFYGFSIPLVPAATRKMVGPKDGQQSPIYPMLAQVPASIGKEYLVQHATPKDLVARIREELLVDTVVWSIEESVKIAQGSTAEGNGQEALNGASPAPQLAAGARGEAPDPLVKQAHIDWIVNQYCKGNKSVLQAICEHFDVERVEQLHVSHFQQLVQAKKEAAAEQEPSSAS
jgi:hypothetical protein